MRPPTRRTRREVTLNSDIPARHPMNAPFNPTSEAATSFVRRHIGPSPRDISAMLETVGASSLSALMAETLPSSIRQKTPLDLGAARSETEALTHMRELASQNQV